MDHEHQLNVDENKTSHPVTDNAVDANHNELHSIYKDLLVQFKQHFGPQFQQNKIFKRVAKLEKTANKLNNQYINQFNAKLRQIIDLSVNEAKKETEQNELINENNAQNNKMIIELIDSIKAKQMKTAKINQSIQEKTLLLNRMSSEESRGKRTLQVIDDENQLLTSLKDQVLNNFNDFKQNIGN